MKTKKIGKKIILNKRTIATLNVVDQFNVHGGAATVIGNSCFPECQHEPGHTEYGDTCYEFCETFNIMCE